MVILDQNVTIYITFRVVVVVVVVVFVYVQTTAQTNFRIFLQTRIMVDGAKFNCYDSLDRPGDF